MTDSRLIPARAGNTRLRWTARAVTAAHPRSRGEHKAEPCVPPPVAGSSPLARGTPANHGCRRRVVPAHPRSRGEHMGSQGSSRSRSGSSPLARGTQVQKFRERWLRRLIPARAGNTRAVAPGRAPGTAHPRSRGEHSELLWLLGQDCGSSPLARGTRGACGASGTLSRLIPARAGNTAMFHVFMMGFPAHPRSRGEHRVREVSG